MRGFSPVVLGALLLAGPGAHAKVVDVMPSSKHSALTLTTDESYGFEVLPGRPLKVDLVGPGSLSVSVRLNHKRKLPVLKGRLEIRRGKKKIKQANLKLHRSRVGAYKEDDSIHPSLPKVFKINVPGGVHAYSFSLRAGRGTSMTILLKYDTEMDQGKARSDEDALALVPLVPAGEPDEGGDDLALAPLAPIAPEEEKPEEPLAEKPPAPKPVRVATVEPPEKPEKEPAPAVETPKEPKAAAIKPIKLPILPKAKETRPPPERDEERKPIARVIDIKPAEEPTGVEQAAPPRSMAIMSIGLKGGQITPLQKVGATTPTGSLDLRFVLPVFDGRLTIGAEGGFYQYKITIRGDREVALMVIPVSLNLFYRIPLGTFLEPFIGLGGDLFICMGEDKRIEDGYVWNEGTAFVFGPHVSVGMEARLGPGFLLLEVRGGYSFGAPAVWEKASISGVSSVAGYRFEF